MNKPQTINDPKTGEPAFVVVPVAEYDALVAAAEDHADRAAAAEGLAYLQAGGETFPAELVQRILIGGENPLRAYREHRSLTQAQLAERSAWQEVQASRTPLPLTSGREILNE